MVISTASAEYIALSHAFHGIGVMMTLLEEIHEHFPIVAAPPNCICNVREDNLSCIKMSQSNKFIPRIKHTALKYHHFKSCVSSSNISLASTAWYIRIRRTSHKTSVTLCIISPLSYAPWLTSVGVGVMLHSFIPYSFTKTNVLSRKTVAFSNFWGSIAAAYCN